MDCFVASGFKMFEIYIYKNKIYWYKIMKKSTNIKTPERNTTNVLPPLYLLLVSFIYGYTNNWWILACMSIQQQYVWICQMWDRGKPYLCCIYEHIQYSFGKLYHSIQMREKQRLASLRMHRRRDIINANFQSGKLNCSFYSPSWRRPFLNTRTIRDWEGFKISSRPGNHVQT